MSFKVITNDSLIDHMVLLVNNYVHIKYGFWHIPKLWSRSQFFITTAAPIEGEWNFGRMFGMRNKNDQVKSTCFAVLTQYTGMTDRQTDRQTERCYSKCHASL